MLFLDLEKGELETRYRPCDPCFFKYIPMARNAAEIRISSRPSIGEP